MRRLNAAIVGLVVFALVDVVLAVLALKSTHVNTATAPASPPSVSPTSAASGSPVSSTSSTAGTATAAATSKATGKVIVVGLSDQRGWRAVSPTTACTPAAKPAQVAYTSDAGGTWKPVDLPLTTVSGMGFAGGALIVTGTDTGCKQASYVLSSSAAPTPTSTPLDWSVSATDPTTLEAAGQAVSSQPCSAGVLDIASDGASDATVLCSDGAIKRSTDAGASWTLRGTVKGAVAIATDSATNKVYVATPATCGLAVGTLDQARSGSSSCPQGASGLSAPADLTIAGSNVWLETATSGAVSQLGALGTSPTSSQ